MAEFAQPTRNDVAMQDDTVIVSDTYPLPPGMDVASTLQYIFKQCSISSSKSINTSVEQIDSANFIKLVKKAPGLLTKRVTTQHVDVVFTKNKPRGERRLYYQNFLMALNDLAALRFPDEDPMTAFLLLLTKHIFGLSLKGLAQSSDTVEGAERTATLIRQNLQLRPELPNELIEKIIAEHDKTLSAPSSRSGTQKGGESNGRGKIAVARQKREMGIGL